MDGEAQCCRACAGDERRTGRGDLCRVTPGLYLVGETRLVAGRQQYIGGAFLVALPGITDAGVWFYDVTAIEKVEEKPYKPPTPPDTTKPGETTEPTGTTASGATGTTAPDETTIPGEVTGTTEPEETTTPGGSTEPGETTEPGTTTEPGGDLPQTGSSSGRARDVCPRCAAQYHRHSAATEGRRCINSSAT